MMMITTPTLFIGEKNKGKYTKDTIFFEGEASVSYIKDFYSNTVISYEMILSKTAAFYDPLGFASPLKTYGSYICRRALIETKNDPTIGVSHSTKEMFFHYSYQVQMMEKLKFHRNKHRLSRTNSLQRCAPRPNYRLKAENGICVQHRQPEC